jgi:hypothetical protein
MAKQTHHPERRRFFRIEDSVYLQLESDEQSDAPTAPANIGESGFYPYINEFRKISAESKHHLHLAENTDPHIAAYLHALNRKIECLAQAILFSQEEQPVEANHSIQLSEGGFSAALEQAYTPGQQLKCKMILYPNNHILFFASEVIYCQEQPPSIPQPSSPIKQLYRVGFEFIHLNEGDSQLLARHIINKQANERRQRQLENQLPNETHS